MNYAELEPDLTLDEAVSQLAETRATIKNLGEAEYILTRHIIEELQGRLATEARTDAGVVKMVIKNSYDPGKLAALREITHPHDLEGVYFAPCEETVTRPERWNMTRGRSLSRLGAEHARIIEGAQIPGRPTITIVAQEEAK